MLHFKGSQKSGLITNLLPQRNSRQRLMRPDVLLLVNQMQRETDSSKANVLFLSEGNVCRSVYAEAIFSTMLAERGLDQVVACASKVSTQTQAS